jgi:CrcB protein
MQNYSSYFLVFMGTGLGGALRHSVNAAALRLFGASFPFGTLTVNVAGSLAMGLLAGLFALKGDTGQASFPDHRHSRRLYDLLDLLA